MEATRPILWNGFSETTPWTVKEKGTDGSVEAGHTMSVRCRIATATVLMRCRPGSRSQCIIVDKKNAEYCELVPRKESVCLFITGVMVYGTPS